MNDKNYQEPNRMNLRRGDYVVIALPHPETATFEEIAEDFTFAGRVSRVYYSDRGVLRVEVEGLEKKTGRRWTWQDRIVAVDRAETVFEPGEYYIDVSIFDIRTASRRFSVRRFRGDVARIGHGEYEIHSFDSGNSYVVKIEKIDGYNYRTNCTCADFTNRRRVCKHINSVFSGRAREAAKAKIAA